MSTYINVQQGIIPQYDDCPVVLRKYIQYIRARKNRTEKTVNGYYLDVRVFIRYLMVTSGTAESSKPDYSDVSIKDCPQELILGATMDDIEAFLYYVVTERRNQPQSMARKLSSIKSFYDYLCTKAHMIKVDPAANVEGPARGKRSQPIYLTYEQCVQALSSIKTESTSRDYCITTLLLNCGMRIGELVGININDVHFDEGYIKILGKGRKERSAYLNEAALVALSTYMSDRALYQKVIDEDALFISPRTGKRLTVRGVQLVVEKILKKSGLSGHHFSPHKFRHTAATLMYQSGADILTLQQILGHESVSTTQIYTHINNDSLADAVASSPLSAIRQK